MLSIYFTRKDGTLISAAGLGMGFIISINPSKVLTPAATYEKLNALVPIDKDGFMASVEKKSDPYEVIAHRVPEVVRDKRASRSSSATRNTAPHKTPPD